MVTLSFGKLAGGSAAKAVPPAITDSIAATASEDTVRLMFRLIILRLPYVDCHNCRLIHLMTFPVAESNTCTASLFGCTQRVSPGFSASRSPNTAHICTPLCSQ